jgi:GAF domain-containing protein
MNISQNPELRSARALDEVLTAVLDSAIEASGAERGFIMLVNDQKQLEFKTTRARGKVKLPGWMFMTCRKIAETAFATGQQTMVEDLVGGDLAAHTHPLPVRIRRGLCTPLRLVRHVDRADQHDGNEIIGVLYLDSRERGALNSSATRAALTTLGAEAALAIENARLNP